MDKFVLITKGTHDSNNKSIVRIPPSCFERVLRLKRKSGIPMCRVIEQCVDFALDHMDGEE